VQECISQSTIADESSAPSRSTQDISFDLSTDDITIGRFSCEEESSLSVTIEDMVASTRLSYASVEGTWKKASVLTTEPNGVVCAPGFGANKSSLYI